MAGTPNAADLRPLPTDSHEISQLWSLVRSGATMSAPVRRSNRVRDKQPTGIPPPPPQPSPRKQKRKQPPTSTDPPSRAKRYPANTRTTPSSMWSSSCLTVGDVGFWDAVIAPCNVKEIEGGIENPEVHFSVSEEDKAPVPGPASFYHTFKGLEVNHIFNDTARDYCEMVAKEYEALTVYKDTNEAEFRRSLYLLFKSELRDQFLKKDYLFRTEATPQGSIATDPESFLGFNSPDLWNTPPSFSPNSAEHFDYDISPGLLYWLSLNGFPEDYQADASSYVHIKGKRKLCPYLAVEYKTSNDEDDDRVSMNQVTAAMLLCLWNRFGLRKRALAAEMKDWKQEENYEIKVYGVRVLADVYDVWAMTPVVNSDGEWQGAEIKRFLRHQLATAVGVERLCEWINEIHRWALTIHAPKVEEDIRVCAVKHRVSPESSLFHRSV